MSDDDTDATIYAYWQSAEDYTFWDGDEVDIYRMFDDGSTITWENLQSRTLSGARELLGVAVAGIVAATMF